MDSLWLDLERNISFVMCIEERIKRPFFYNRIADNRRKSKTMQAVNADTDVGEAARLRGLTEISKERTMLDRLREWLEECRELFREPRIDKVCSTDHISEILC